MLPIVNTQSPDEEYCTASTIPDATTGLVFCTECEDGYYLVRMSDRIICAPLNLTGNGCTVTITGKSQYSYELITVPNTKAQICYSCAEISYGSCMSCSETIQSTYDEYMTQLYESSFGCDICASGYKRNLVTDSYLSTYIRNCSESTIATEQTCSWTESYDSTGAVCRSCYSTYPNCATCTSSGCTTCKTDFYLTTTKTQALASQSICLYKGCGFSSSTTTLSCPNLDTWDSTCLTTTTLSNCQLCQYSSGAYTCTLCSTGYYLSGGACIARTSTATLKYYVMGNASYVLATTTTSTETNTEPAFNTNDGTTWATPYLFIQQALYQIYTTANQYTSVTATIYLSKGYHSFFYCIDSILASRSEYATQFCTKTAMQFQYQKCDNVKLYVKALTCSYLKTELSTTSLTTTQKKFCVDTGESNPTVYVNGPMFYFNITKYGYFENIIFDGSQALAYYTSGGSIVKGFNMWDFPMTYCTITAPSEDIQKAITITTNTLSTGFPLPFTCSDQEYQGSTMPSKSTECKTSPTTPQSVQKCGGEPYHEDFFKWDDVTKFYYARRKVLFNLYNFDSKNTQDNTNATQLEIVGCKFQYFLREYEALIYVENNNFYHRGSLYSGGIGYLGENRGANIKISTSTFKHSRFCKGLIVYREAPFIMNGFLYNFTHAQLSKYSYPIKYTNQILIKSSTFQNLNWATNVTALAAYKNQLVNKKYTTSGVIAPIKVPQFYHKGIVLNIEDFYGPVEFQSCTVKNNFHFIPEIFIFNHSTTQEYTPQSFYMNSLDEYAMALCTTSTTYNKYFFADAFSFDTEIEELFNSFERLSTIYINRNANNMVFANNYFYRNMGTFGGAITITSPNMRTSNKAYVVIYQNTFYNNQAYMSGNAIFVRQTKRNDKISQQCAGVLVYKSTFNLNFGLKKHNGGAMTIYCDHLADTEKTDLDYTKYSSYLNIWFAAESFNILVDPVSDPLGDGTEYPVYAFRTAIMGSTFSENFSGNKGTAIYARYQSSFYVTQCTFSSNYPVTQFYEQRYSPYFYYLAQSSRPITYYDETDTCSSDFSYLQSCGADGYAIDMSIPDSTIKSEHCNDEYCMEDEVVQETTITLCTFYDNEVAPFFFTESGRKRASCIYVSEGFSISIGKNTFYNQNGKFQYETNYVFTNMGSYLPAGYFGYATVPIIRVNMNGGTSTGIRVYNTYIYENLFYNNKNYQAYGLAPKIAEDMDYHGAIIALRSNTRKQTYSLSNLTLTSNRFFDNIVKGDDIGLIYALNTLITARNNTFKNNGYLSQVEYTNVPESITKYGYYFPYKSYQFQEAMQYGIFFIRITNVMYSNYSNTFESNKFSFTFAKDGAAYYIDAIQPFASNFTGNTYNFMFAEYGSVIDIDYNPIQTSTILYNTFSKELVQNQFNHYFGAFYLENDNDQMAISIKSTTFLNCQGLKGSAIYMYKGGVIYCSLCNFTYSNYGYTNKTSQLIAKAYSSSYKNNLTNFINYTYLDTLQKISQEAGYLYFESSYTTSTQTVKYLDKTVSDFQNKYKNYQYFINCVFYKLTGIVGSAIYSKDSKIYMANNATNSTTYMIYNNTAALGTIFLDSTTFITDKIAITSNTAAQASAIYITSSASVTMTNSQIYSNTVNDQGTLFFRENGMFSCNYCYFYKNTGNEGVIMYAQNSATFNGITFNNTYFQNNTGVFALISLVQSAVNMSNSLYKDNYAQGVTHGFSAFNSKIFLNKTYFTFTSSLIQAATVVDFGLFTISFQTQLYLYGVTIENSIGGVSATVSVQGNSYFYALDGTKFINNNSPYGRVLVLSSAYYVIFDQTTFLNNYPESIYTDSVDLTISRSTFQYSSSVYVRGVNAQITIFNSTFKDAFAQADLGMAINCQCLFINITNSYFQNLTTQYGGALYLKAYSTSFFYIANSYFADNHAIKGGAIYLESINNMVYVKNTFYMNYADVLTLSSEDYNMGGAIFYGCPPAYGFKCNLTLSSTNQFLSNYAKSQGGAIAWINTRYNNDNTTVFYNNSAAYGNNTSSYAKNIEINFISSNDWSTEGQTTTTRLLSTRDRTSRGLTTEEYTIVSGTKFYFEVNLYDQEDELMGQETQAKAYITPSASTYISVSLTGNYAQAQNGVFNFSNIRATFKPSKTIEMNLYLRDIQSYGNALDFITAPYSFYLSARACVAGEKYTSDYQCQQCPEGSYSYDAPENVLDCKDCDIHAYCFGGTYVAPKPGYWRATNTSTDIIACPRAESCLGGDKYNPLGSCAEGYEGVLCTKCASGYLKKGRYSCEKCTSKTNQVFQLAFVIFIGIFIVWIFVVATLYSVKDNKPLLCVYLRIMVSHLHLVSIILSIDYNWPDKLDGFMNSQQSAASFTSFGFSTECLVSSLYAETNSTNSTTTVNSYNDGTSFYLKVLFYCLLPGILILCGIAFWAVRDLIRRTFKDFKNEIVTTAVILFFIAHPSITKMMFSAFNCQQIDSDQKLVADFSITCWVGSHIAWAMGLAAPYTLFWVIGIPVAVLLLLLKIRKTFLAMAEKETIRKEDKLEQRKQRNFWGFLFQGYELKYFYWEVIIQVRKILLIIVVIFLSTVSNETAALLGVLILVVNIVMQVLVKPFYHPSLNTMENYSLLVCVVTMYSGVFHTSAPDFTNIDGMQYLFIVVIIIPNIIFYPFWMWCVYIEILKISLHEEKYKIFKILTLTLWNREKFRRRYLPDEGELDQDLTDEDRSGDEHGGRENDYEENDDEHVDHEDIELEENEQKDENLKEILVKMKKGKGKGVQFNDGEKIDEDFDQLEDKNKSKTQSKSKIDMNKSKASNNQSNYMASHYGSSKHSRMDIPRINISSKPGPSQGPLLEQDDEEFDDIVEESSSIEPSQIDLEFEDDYGNEFAKNPLQALYQIQQNLILEQNNVNQERKIEFRTVGNDSREKDKKIENQQVKETKKLQKQVQEENQKKKRKKKRGGRKRKRKADESVQNIQNSDRGFETLSNASSNRGLKIEFNDEDVKMRTGKQELKRKKQNLKKRSEMKVGQGPSESSKYSLSLKEGNNDDYNLEDVMNRSESHYQGREIGSDHDGIFENDQDIVSSPTHRKQRK